MQSTSEHKELRLRKKLIILFLVFSLVPLPIVGIGAHVVGKGLIYNSVVSHLQSIVLAKKRVVETFLKERDSDLRFLVDSITRNDLMKQDILTKQIHNMLARKEMYKRVVKGAFTGAVSNKRGVFEVADKGTIFLDEVGDN